MKFMFSLEYGVYLVSCIQMSPYYKWVMTQFEKIGNWVPTIHQLSANTVLYNNRIYRSDPWSFEVTHSLVSPILFEVDGHYHDIMSRMRKLDNTVIRFNELMPDISISSTLGVVSKTGISEIPLDASTGVLYKKKENILFVGNIQWQDQQHLEKNCIKHKN
jgi:hypothetical protein